MSKIDIDAKRDSVFILERQSFSNDSIREIAMGVFSMLAMTFLAMGLAGTDDRFLPLSFSILVLFWVPVSILLIRSGVIASRRARFVLSDSCVRLESRGEEMEIALGPGVTVDVRTDRWTAFGTHGPLAGLRFRAGDGREVVLDTKEGWSLDDIRHSWKPFIEVVREKELKMDEGLVEYLEFRSKKGLDSTNVPGSHEV